jgi:phosphatidylinositol 3-kinase
MISLMDRLLKKVNLDLKLHTYGILALSKEDGIMEFVSNSEAVSAILKEHKSITQFLRFHNPDRSGPYEIAPVALDTFVKSCAASCVVTYILGIGDRHLDNIMMRTNGQLFHIDFGFIFGQDPKPFPPPFRFTRPMADAMGGEDSPHYAQFKGYCCQAYNWLRKDASLILNLLSLMADTGIKDISQRSNINKVLEATLNKFRLDLTDEQAEHFFLGLINDSLRAVMPVIMEGFHQFAVARR